jgi:hypothetical protein
MIPLVFTKAHNKGYTRKDGTYVAPFDDHRSAASPPVVAGSGKQQQSAKPVVNLKNAADYVSNLLGKPHAPLFAAQSTPPRPPRPPDAWHPKRDEKGKPVPIHYAHQPSSAVTWHHPHQIATVTPGSPMPSTLQGVPLVPWQPPLHEEDWTHVAGQNHGLAEPPFDPGKLEPAAGVVITEPDGRVWVVCPTNRHAGYRATYPKGHAEHGMSLQATAIKEAFEESGMKVEITGWLGDFDGGLTRTRYYQARRVGGTPAAMGWESQAVMLVPAAKLGEVVNSRRDRQIAAALTS